MREIGLVSWRDVKNHVEDIKTSLEIIYEVKLDVDFENIQIASLYPTEGFFRKG